MCGPINLSVRWVPSFLHCHALNATRWVYYSWPFTNFKICLKAQIQNINHQKLANLVTLKAFWKSKKNWQAFKNIFFQDWKLWKKIWNWQYRLWGTNAIKLFILFSEPWKIYYLQTTKTWLFCCTINIRECLLLGLFLVILAFAFHLPQYNDK